MPSGCPVGRFLIRQPLDGHGRGQGKVISAFVVLKQRRDPSDNLKRELVDAVRRELGPVAVIGDLRFVSMLPKTRWGKIMRRVLKAATLGKDPGDITSIEDEGSVEDGARLAGDQRGDLRARAIRLDQQPFVAGIGPLEKWPF